MYTFLAFILLQVLPTPVNHVTDPHDYIPDGVEEQLNRDLAAYADSTTIEIALYVTDTFGDVAPVDVTIAMFREWGVGNPDLSNGISIAMAVDDREIFVGTDIGIEPYLTDASAGTLLRRHAVPHFKEEAYVDGLVALINGLVGHLGNDTWEMREAAKAEREERIARQQKAFMAGFLWVMGFVGLGGIVWFGVHHLRLRQRLRDEKELKMDQLTTLRGNMTLDTSDATTYLRSHESINHYRDKINDAFDTFLDQSIAVEQAINDAVSLDDLSGIELFPAHTTRLITLCTKATRVENTLRSLDTGEFADLTAEKLSELVALDDEYRSAVERTRVTYARYTVAHPHSDLASRYRKMRDKVISLHKEEQYAEAIDLIDEMKALVSVRAARLRKAITEMGSLPELESKSDDLRRNYISDASVLSPIVSAAIQSGLITEYEGKIPTMPDRTGDPKHDYTMARNTISGMRALRELISSRTARRASAPRYSDHTTYNPIPTGPSYSGYDGSSSDDNGFGGFGGGGFGGGGGAGSSW